MSTRVALLALSVTLALTQHAVGQVSDNVVRIGLLTDYTGVFSALSGQGGVTAALYEWNVQTTRAWMNLLAPVARPIFAVNHDYVMRNGGQGLARLLGAPLLALD